MRISGPSAVGATATSIEARLAELGKPALLLDTKSPWLPATPVHYGTFPMPLPLRDHWDGILYLEHSPPMDSVFW